MCYDRRRGMVKKERKELEKMKKRMDEEIARGNIFTELTFGYTRAFYDIDLHGMRVGGQKTEFVDMAKPRSCSYNKTGSHGFVEKTITIEAPPLYSTSSMLPVEYCGITMRQLQAVLANMERRCVAEGWTDDDGNLLTPDIVNLNHLNKYIIKPFTMEHKTSFVEALPSTAGPQLPRFFVSNWYGDPVRDSSACIERVIVDFRLNYNDDDDARGGGMSDDTPFWVFAYASNQWKLGNDITTNPKESGFTRAMMVASNRTITILDKEGVVFSRAWCLYELFLTLEESKKEHAEEESKGGVWGVYTAYTHTYKQLQLLGGRIGGREEERQALGIISGGSTSDLGNNESSPDRIAAREAAFPYNLIKKSLCIKVEIAEASLETDTTYILNSIVGTSAEDIDAAPPLNHEKYVQLNNSLRATFASSAASLRGAADEGGEGWNKMLTVLSKGTMRGKMEFDFRPGGRFDGLTIVQATELVEHLPLYLDNLWIRNVKHCFEFMNGLIKRVKLFHNLKDLRIFDILIGGEEGGQEAGVRFAEMLSTNTTIKELWLRRTDLITIENVEKWGDALMQNNTMTELWLGGVGGNNVNLLKVETENRIPNLRISN